MTNTNTTENAARATARLTQIEEFAALLGHGWQSYTEAAALRAYLAGTLEYTRDEYGVYDADGITLQAHYESATITITWDDRTVERVAWRCVGLDGSVLWESVPESHPFDKAPRAHDTMHGRCKAEATMREDGRLPRLPRAFSWPGHGSF